MSEEPKVAIFSLMRDRADKIQGYKDQIYSFDYSNWTVNVCEGDSVDNTYEILKAWEREEPRVKIYKLDLHRPLYGSVVCPERFLILGTCNDYMLNDLASDESIDYYFYLQMDLRFWNPKTVIRDLIDSNKDIVGGMVWGNDVMYDTWGMTFLDGSNFPPLPKSWYQANGYNDIFEVSTVGSFFLAKGEIIRNNVRFGIEEDVKEFCRNARLLGYRVWCNPNINANHT